jgi:streptomycin 3"-adenylyltransferase
VLEEVPWEDLVRGTVDEIHVLLPGIDEETDTRNGVLTLARIWATLATGEILSKDAAADWALEQLPEEHRAVPARARAIYVGDEDERWDDLRGRVRPYADYVIDVCRGLPRARPA